MSIRTIDINSLEASEHRSDICFFTVSISGGGAERILLYLANHFAMKGLKVDVVVCKKSVTEELEDLIPLSLIHI